MDTRREIETELTHYFSEILKEDVGERSREIEQITRLVPRMVTAENNEMLIKPIEMLWERLLDQTGLLPTSSTSSGILSRRTC